LANKKTAAAERRAGATVIAGSTRRDEDVLSDVVGERNGVLDLKCDPQRRLWRVFGGDV